MKDPIIQEIQKYFIENGFKETIINNRKVYKYKNNKYYTVSSDNTAYYLEYAENLDEAKKNMYGDMDSYNSELGYNYIVDEIRKDIIKYIINKLDEVKYADTPTFRYAT